MQALIAPTDLGRDGASAAFGGEGPGAVCGLERRLGAPIELSAYLSPLAAAIEAKVSGSDVPSATKVIAVTAGFSPIWQPISEAKSEMSTTCTTGEVSSGSRRVRRPPPAGRGRLEAPARRS